MTTTSHGTLSRGLAVIETLVGETDGLTLANIAERVDLPKSATHRILTNLVADGWAVQSGRNGEYSLTLTLVSAGLRHLASSTLTDLAMPTLEALAKESRQLVRLALADNDRLIWVARCQGARSGLRYDPDIDHGQEIPLSTTATGQAWLSSLDHQEALRIALTAPSPTRHEQGPNVPRTAVEIEELIIETRERGWGEVHDANELGISAMAMPVKDALTNAPVGAVSIAGPSVQFTSEKMKSLSSQLQLAVESLSNIVMSRSQSFKYAG